MEGRLQGLAPVFVDTKAATLRGGLITLGARGDSYYEYLLKQWLLSGKKDEAFLQYAPPPPRSNPIASLLQLVCERCLRTECVCGGEVHRGRRFTCTHLALPRSGTQ